MLLDSLTYTKEAWDSCLLKWILKGIILIDKLAFNLIQYFSYVRKEISPGDSDSGYGKEPEFLRNRTRNQRKKNPKHFLLENCFHVSLNSGVLLREPGRTSSKDKCY